LLLDSETNESLPVNTPFPAYKGTDSFVFICYSHADAGDVYPELEFIRDSGIPVWYDEGIRPGSEWTDELAAAIDDCEHFLFFVTPRSVDSRHCRDEVQYALKLGKSIVVVYLEPTELPRGLELVLGSIQAVHRAGFRAEDYQQRLLEAIDPGRMGDLPKAVPGDGYPAPKVDAHPARTRRIGLGVLAGVVLLAVIAGAVFLSPTDESETSQEIVLTANSLAVLPLENRGGFEDDPYYPDSVSEDLLNRLTDIESLELASRRSSFAFRQEEIGSLGLVAIGRRLGVTNLLSGYVVRRNDRLRVNLELIDISSGREIVRWSNNYDDRPLAEMLVIQSDVTRAIAREFMSEGLSRADEDRIARQSTQSPAAYDFYLQARTILREPLDDDISLQHAAELFNRALALDPDFVWAQAGLCATHVRAYRLGRAFDPARESCGRLETLNEDLFEVNLALGNYYRDTGELERASIVLARAVDQVPGSADARIALAQLFGRQAYLSESELDRVRAQEAFLEAMSMEPDYWFSYHEYGNFLTQTSRLEEALEQMKIALSIEPGSVGTLTNYGNTLYRLGRNEEAEAAWTQALTLTGNDRWAHEGLGVMYHYQQRYEEAVQHLQAACDIFPDDHRLWGKLGESLRMLSGSEEAARDAFARAVSLAEEDARIDPNEWSTVGFMAMYKGYLGEFEAADVLLERMFELNPGGDPMTHYWAGLVAAEAGDIDASFQEFDLALANGFAKQKHFIADEPALAVLRREHGERFQAMLDRH